MLYKSIFKMRKAPTSIKVSYHKKAHQSKWKPLKRGKVPTSIGVTNTNKFYKKTFQKVPTSVVVSYTKKEANSNKEQNKKIRKL